MGSFLLIRGPLSHQPNASSRDLGTLGELWRTLACLNTRDPGHSVSTIFSGSRILRKATLKQSFSKFRDDTLMLRPK